MKPQPRPAALLALLALAPLLASARPAPERLAGRLITADGGAPGPMRVVLRQGARADTAAVAEDGSFALEVARPRGEAEVRVEGLGIAARRFHPAVARLRAGDLADELRVVLVPRVWAVRSGRYAGTLVEISLELAFEPACRDCSSFFREGVRDAGSGRPTSTPTWPARAFPLRVAFRGETLADRISPRDSAAFWRAAEDLEADLGRDLLRPARYGETLPDERGSPEDVVLVEADPRLRRVGWGSTISQGGDIIYGAIRVRGAELFSERGASRLLKHEMLHALGLGHTCAWRSVMAQIPECASLAADAPTAEDVAYFEVLGYARELQRIFRAQLGLEAALRGERERSAEAPRG
jgi:hypothetical protein